jgi:hypothetical protein
LEKQSQASLSKMFKDIMKIEWRSHQDENFQFAVFKQPRKYPKIWGFLGITCRLILNVVFPRTVGVYRVIDTEDADHSI